MKITLGNLESLFLKAFITCICTHTHTHTYSRYPYKSLLVAQTCNGFSLTDSNHHVHLIALSMLSGVLVDCYIFYSNRLGFKLLITCNDIQVLPKMLKNAPAHTKCSIMLWCT